MKADDLLIMSKTTTLDPVWLEYASLHYLQNNSIDLTIDKCLRLLMVLYLMVLYSYTHTEYLSMVNFQVPTLFISLTEKEEGNRQHMLGNEEIDCLLITSILMTQLIKQFHLFPSLHFFQNSSFLSIITLDIISLISCGAE